MARAIGLELNDMRFQAMHRVSTQRYLSVNRPFGSIIH